MGDRPRRRRPPQTGRNPGQGRRRGDPRRLRRPVHPHPAPHPRPPHPARRRTRDRRRRGRQKLAEEEATAEERSRLSIRDLGDGTSRISGIIPTPAANRLDTYLDALTSPRHRDPDTVEDENQTTETGDAEPLEPTTTELPDGTEILGCHDEGDRIPLPQEARPGVLRPAGAARPPPAPRARRGTPPPSSSR
ncbi:hypothetical protein [Nocardioides sp. TF02-7]|uniref:hypothetical protein n=1 Tax=Nocardioides sp. TF02-7 TaxID=2917724 RepID=UPI001F0592CB|nr:hypothetical protein [Nocardioides sp. TF02-7]UMG92360.1 hypothetical protein MF408_21130 [Nocardioides sp. TF02-7]